MRRLKENWIDLVIAIWLLVVGLQYVSSYFYDLGVDFRFAYCIMLLFTVSMILWKTISTGHRNRKTDSDNQFEAVSAVGSGKNRRPRR